MLPEIDADPEVLETDAGTCRVWRPRPHVFLSQVSGRMVQGHAELIMRIGTRVVEDCPRDAIGIHEWTEIESYEVAVHTRMTAWSMRVMPKMVRVLVAAESPLVKLAVRTVSLATDNRIELLDGRGAVEAALRELL